MYVPDFSEDHSLKVSPLSYPSTIVKQLLLIILLKIYLFIYIHCKFAKKIIIIIITWWTTIVYIFFRSTVLHKASFEHYSNIYKMPNIA